MPGHRTLSFKILRLETLVEIATGKTLLKHQIFKTSKNTHWLEIMIGRGEAKEIIMSSV